MNYLKYIYHGSSICSISYTEFVVIVFIIDQLAVGFFHHWCPYHISHVLEVAVLSTRSYSMLQASSSVLDALTISSSMHHSAWSVFRPVSAPSSDQGVGCLLPRWRLHKGTINVCRKLGGEHFGKNYRLCISLSPFIKWYSLKLSDLHRDVQITSFLRASKNKLLFKY